MISPQFVATGTSTTTRDACLVALGGALVGAAAYFFFPHLRRRQDNCDGSDDKEGNNRKAVTNANANANTNTSNDTNATSASSDSDDIIESAPAGIAVITGASKGIGLATAKAFAEKGWEVINISRTDCTVQHKNIVTRRTDLGKHDFEVELSRYVSERFPSPRRICLVHNAALMLQDSSLAVDADAMRAAFQVNVVAPAILNKLFSPLMAAGSSILYIGSTLSEKGIPGSASYVASKHAIAGLMKVTCQDLKGRPVHTACICPGFTATEMLVQHLGASPEVHEAILGMQTMGRLLDPSEIAAFIRFCADNPSINGAVLHCNLGQVER